MALTKLQAAFVREILTDPKMEGAAAVLRAGYKTRHPGTQARDLLSNPEIKAAVDAEIAARIKRTQISADWVLTEAVALYTLAKNQAQAEPTSKMLGAATRALETVGKHVGVQAFREKVEHDVSDRLVDLIEKSMALK